MHVSFQATLQTLRSRNAARISIVLLGCILGACQTAPPPRPVVVEAPRAAQPVLPPPISAAELARQAALRELVGYQDRLYRVAAPLLLDNAPLCKRHSRSLLGFTAKNKYSYSSEYVDSAQSVLGLGEQLQVVGIMAGSGAAESGVQRGDKLIAVEDTPLPQGQTAEHLASQALVSQLNKKTAIDLKLNRQGADLSIKVPLTQACAFIVELGNTDSVNAYGDGYRVLITRGMLNFAKSDSDLAIILASEMAHNVQGDVTRQHTTAAVAAVIDNLTRIHPESGVGVDGVKPTAQDANIGADRLGLYMAARAGFEISGAREFWSRLSTLPDSYVANHPLTTTRLAAIANVVAEIQDKQAAGKPLLPASLQASQKSPAPQAPANSQRGQNAK